MHILFVLEEDEHTELVEEYSSKRKTLTDEAFDDIIDDVIDKAVGAVKTNHEMVGRIGEPVEEIIEYAREVDARYIVIGGRSRSPVGKALFSSVTQSVLLNADRPVVTIMRPRVRRQSRRTQR